MKFTSGVSIICIPLSILSFQIPTEQPIKLLPLSSQSSKILSPKHKGMYITVHSSSCLSTLWGNPDQNQWWKLGQNLKAWNDIEKKKKLKHRLWGNHADRLVSLACLPAFLIEHRSICSFMNVGSIKCPQFSSVEVPSSQVCQVDYKD